VKFVIFAGSPRTFWRFGGGFFFPPFLPPITLCACWLCSGYLRFQARYFLTRAINPRCFLVFDFAPPLQVSMYSSHDSKQVKMSYAVVQVVRGLKNNSPSSVALLFM
jgi:hypothetical protein